MLSEDKDSLCRGQTTRGRICLLLFFAMVASPWRIVDLGAARAAAQLTNPTPTPAGSGGGAQTGPPVTSFAVANGNGCACCNDPGCLCGPPPTPLLDNQGRQIFVRPISSGFILVVEGGGTVPSGPLPIPCSSSQRPVLQIESSRQLGPGPTPPAMCPPQAPGATPTPDFTTAIPAYPTPDFGPSTGVTIALQEFAHRFGTFGTGASACTFDCSGNPNALNPTASALQFCYLVGAGAAFPTGDTTLRARFIDGSQNAGPVKEIVVRVPSGSSFAVSGHLRYYSNLQPVANATVDAFGAGTTSTSSDASGLYTFPSLATGNWQITPRKNLGAGTAITALDAVYVLQSTVGLRTFTTQQALAADVTGNGIVSALDAILILQFTIGLISHFPVGLACNSDWAFVPVPASGTPPIISSGSCQRGTIPVSAQADNQDFSAVLFGDPSGNWVPPGGGGANLSRSQTTDAIAELGRARRRGSRVNVPVFIRGARDYQAVELQLNYDPSQLGAPSVRRLPSARQALIAVNDRTPGNLRVSLASSRPMHGGAALNLQFTAIGTGRAAPVEIVASTIQ